ncbi:FHA domain-containing protein [Streptomyces longwoodensis]|uniref:FHA domain-containing protein n=1 Tax=Streptomyces longwoodensis TaxID=68231 RepID=UPI0037001D72
MREDDDFFLDDDLGEEDAAPGPAPGGTGAAGDAGEALEGKPPTAQRQRPVDRGLADDDFFLSEADDASLDDAPEAVRLPPWTPQPSTDTAGPVESAACWSCAQPVPAGVARCPECQESTRHLRLTGTRPAFELRHGVGPPLRLGRHPVWAAQLAAVLSCEPGVSRHHATLRLTPSGDLWLRENPHGTPNGTYVNDERLPRGARVALKDGDVVRLGRHATFTVRLEG